MFVDAIAKLLGEWSQNFNIYSCIFRLVLAVILAMIAGSERATKLHAAGLKTFICVAMVASLGALGDLYLTAVVGAGFGFIVPAVVIGIAIISGNTLLYSSKNKLRGLTTSVGLWVVGLIAVVIGFGLYTIGLIAFVIFMSAIMILPKVEKFIKKRSVYLELHIELKSREGLQVFIGTLRKVGLQVKDIEANPAFANSGLAVYSVTVKINDPSLKDKSHADIVAALSALENVNYVEEIY